MSKILSMLRDRHSKDLCVSECKDGPTWSRAHKRLDLWVLKRTWSPVTLIGYEIKRSRSDFLGDDKWQSYLPCCNQLYFVCPYKLIGVAEVGETAGLIWESKKGGKLFTKKKAPWREIEAPVSLLLYVLMSRTKIMRSTFSNLPEEDENPVEYWRAWLAAKEERRAIGRKARSRIAEIARETAKENERLKQQIETLQEIRQRIVELGFKPEQPINFWSVKNKLESLAELIPIDLKRRIKELHQDTGRVLEKIEEVEHD